MNLLFILTLVTGYPVERIVRIAIPEHGAVYRLNRQVEMSIIDARDNHVTAYATDETIQRLRELGYGVTVLVEDYAGQAALDLVVYHTYAEVCSLLRRLAAEHPHIARLDTLGLSYNGFSIPRLAVSSGQNQARPRIRLIGAHHGNEKISTEITLDFARYLCENYGIDPTVTRLVNTRAFCVIPILNPDGHITNRRHNGAGRDLNRDYGYEWETYSEPYSQPETRALLAAGDDYVPATEFAYHSTASYVNYLWDNHPADPPDSAWVIALSRRYADSTYGSSTTRLQPINGYGWYEVHGSCQDFTFGLWGAPAWTIETQLPSTRPRIDSICVANRRALLDMAELAGRGINGLVYDSLTGSPLFARIEFTSPPRWPAYSSPRAGDFHKMLAPGTYSVTVWVNGYEPKAFADLVLPDTGLFLDAPMAKPRTKPWYTAQKILALKRTDDNHVLSDWVYNAFGEPDYVYYNLGTGQSSVIFDLSRSGSAHNRLGNDIIVYAQGSYTLAAAENGQGPWHVLGNATGNASFDLGAVGLDSARFLRLTNVFSASLDAIRYFGPEGSGLSEGVACGYLPRLDVFPVPARFRAFIILYAPLDHRAQVCITDVYGRTVRRLASGTGTDRMMWNLEDELGRPVPAGVYFCRLESARYPVQKKILVVGTNRQ